MELGEAGLEVKRRKGREGRAGGRGRGGGGRGGAGEPIAQVRGKIYKTLAEILILYCIGGNKPGMDSVDTEYIHLTSTPRVPWKGTSLVFPDPDDVTS